MTCRDYILYILENGLEDKPLFENGNLIGFMNEVQTAMKFDVGISTIRLWIQCGFLEHVKLGDTIYIPKNAKDPRKKESVDGECK